MKVKYFRKALLITAAFLALSFMSSCEGEPAALKENKQEAVKPPESPEEKTIVLDESGKAVPDSPEPSVPEKENDSDTINIPVPEEIADNEPVEEEPEENSFEGYVLSESDVSENGVYLKSVRDEGRVVIDFAGDINFDDRYSNMISLRSRGGGVLKCIDKAFTDRTNAADIFMINNEFPYSSRGTPTAGKKFTFRAKPETVSFMQDMGADIVSLANNHAYDHGPEALLDTFDTLTNAGIPYVGAGHDLSEAMRPVYFIAGGMKLSFVAATQIERSLPPDTKEATETEPGVLRTLDPEKFISVIREAKENSDFCIVFVHWGSENTNAYEAAQTELAVAYEEAGADLIIGAHPHVLQGLGYINETPVVYSLGNYWFNSKRMDTGLVEAVIADKKLESLRFFPGMQYDCYTHAVPQDSADHVRILEELRKWSKSQVIIDDEGYITKGTQ